MPHHLVALLSLTLAGAPAGDLEQLARDAHTIARGTIVATSSRWSSDHRIITDISFEVSDGFKNVGKGSVLNLLHRGGHLDGVVQRVGGVPELHTGDEVVLFLERRPGNRYRVLGGDSATWRVQTQLASNGTQSLPVETLRHRIESAQPQREQPAVNSTVKVQP